MSFQHSPPSVSGGPNVLTRSQRRRQQEAEGSPQLYEPSVASQVPKTKNKRKTAEQCSQRRVCQSHSMFWW